MRDPQRIDRIVSLFAAEWKLSPHQRFGQLFANLTGHHRDPFHVGDDELEQVLVRSKKQHLGVLEIQRLGESQKEKE